MKPMAALWRFALAAVVGVIMLVLIANVVTQPFAPSTRTYRAQFTDVSGLHDGADVRVRGVRVGKVEAIHLERSEGRTLAVVGFTLDKRFSIVRTSHLAVKFQALTGLRYLDIAGAMEDDLAPDRLTNVPTTMTQPSLDITVLFNGLQPVLATLSPDDINTFTENATAFLAGDGRGLAPMLDSIHKLSGLVADREKLISTLVGNLTTLANGIKDRSQYLIQVLETVKVPMNGAMSVLDEFRKGDVYGAFPWSAVHLLDAAGIKPGIDIDKAMDKAFTNVYDAIDSFKRVPVIWENIQVPPPGGSPVPCSHGRADLPLPVDVLLNGRKVVLCHQ